MIRLCGTTQMHRYNILDTPLLTLSSNDDLRTKNDQWHLHNIKNFFIQSLYNIMSLLCYIFKLCILLLSITFECIILPICSLKPPIIKLRTRNWFG